MSTRFTALGDDHIHTMLSGLVRLLHRMDLVYHQYASIVHPLDKIAWVTACERNGGRPGSQGQREGFFVQRE
jgi:hypothetical protein